MTLLPRRSASRDSSARVSILLHIDPLHLSNLERQQTVMNGYPGTVAPPGGLYVRALYDYETDDHTSLSFRQGDVIQVLTQLESGWWDGVIHGIRGWFPSNYCTIVNRPPENSDEEGTSQDIDEEEADEYSEPDFMDRELNGASRNASFNMSLEEGGGNDQEEAAFWIPQATPDGRLFYFNTLTGVSTMELPLENPTSLTETGPRDRTNVHIPEYTRPPPELMAGGFERDEETDYDVSASEAEGKPFSKVCVMLIFLVLLFSELVLATQTPLICL